jgi:membrane-anchored protein YejM (alkaline phosphatase superfamily)
VVSGAKTSTPASSQSVTIIPVSAEPPPLTERRDRSGVLWRYFALTTVALLVNHLNFLTAVDSSGVIAWTYAAAVYLTGPLLHLFLAFSPVLILNAVLGRRPVDPAQPGRRRRDLVVYATAAVLFTALQGVTLLDGYVYHLYGFHLNGMVLNLVLTPGGVNSMAAGVSTYLVLAAVVLGLVAVQVGLLLAVLRLPRLRRLWEGKLTKRRGMALVASVLLLLAAEKIAYSVSVFRSYGAVPAASAAFPIYIPITFSTTLRRLGFKGEQAGSLRLGGAGSSHLDYPLKPIVVDPAAKPLNVMWLVSESLRWDMMDPAIMPAACGFGDRALRFTRHYSGGNGTRMGMFSMFYGLTGNYWQPFLAEHRSPVLMDRVVDAGYELFLHTSAEFSFPELDKTVFSRVPKAQLHEGKAPERWRRDRENLDAIFASIDKRDPARPFFTFMFFESPHAPYTFPEECALTKPYVADLNYLTMDLKKDIGAIKNSYINACRHLDTQLDRVFKFLAQKGLLESTIVLVTGDHGEEFMEKGRWGHHSAFSEEQIRVPLILHVPGVAPAVIDRMTSHLDLPATILPRLGVKNPAEDYGLGVDLVAGPPREWLMVSGWTEVVYLDDGYKAIFPVKSYNMARREVTTRDDVPADKSAFLSARRDQVTKFMKDLRRFQ